MLVVPTVCCKSKVDEVRSCFYNHAEPSLPASHYVVCVWCFMNFKWGLTLFLYALISFKYLDKVVNFQRMVNENFNDDVDEEGEAEVRTDLEANPTGSNLEEHSTSNGDRKSDIPA